MFETHAGNGTGRDGARARARENGKTVPKIDGTRTCGLSLSLLLFDLTEGRRHETLAFVSGRTVFCLSFSPVDFRNFSGRVVQTPPPHSPTAARIPVGT